MERNREQLHNFNDLLSNDRLIADTSKEETARILFSVKTEFDSLQTTLTSLRQEMAMNRSAIDEFGQKEQQVKAQLEDMELTSAETAVIDITRGYEALGEIQAELKAAKERQSYFKHLIDDAEMRLTELRARMESIGTLSSNLGALAEDLKHMFEQIDKMQPLVQSQNFGFKIINAQEEERRRVSREIHDGPAQAMANVIFLAEVCERLIEIDTDRAKEELRELRQQIRGCLDETRKIIFDLRPMVLDDLGLIPAVKRIADIFKDRSEGKTNVKVSVNNTKKLESVVEVSLSGLFRNH